MLPCSNDTELEDSLPSHAIALKQKLKAGERQKHITWIDHTLTSSTQIVILYHLGLQNGYFGLIYKVISTQWGHYILKGQRQAQVTMENSYMTELNAFQNKSTSNAIILPLLTSPFLLQFSQIHMMKCRIKIQNSFSQQKQKYFWFHITSRYAMGFRLHSLLLLWRKDLSWQMKTFWLCQKDDKNIKDVAASRNAQSHVMVSGSCQACTASSPQAEQISSSYTCLPEI